MSTPTNQDPIETVVRRVADAFSWEVHGDYVRPDPGGMLHRLDSGTGLIILAAYAEAALHDLGWMANPDGNSRLASIGFFEELKEQAGQECRTTKDWEYDPKDPVSKSKAILRAVDEAIGGGG